MRAVFVALGVYVGVGGMERFNQRVVRCLLEPGDGCPDGLVIALWDGQAQRRLAPAPGRFLAGGRSKLRTVLRFAWELWRRRPEAVLYGHVLLSPLALLARLLSPRSRNLLVAHGAEVWREPFRKRIPIWQKLAVLGGVDEVVSVSRFTASRMSRAFGLPLSRFRLLPNAVDADGAARSLRPRRGAEPRLLTVTRLGRKDHYKGCDKVIRALARVLEQAPGAHYEIVGDGALRPMLERLAAECGVRDRVHFHGYVDDGELERLYEGADLMIMPSTGEGFGIVYLEAWKHALPVIAGDRDAGAEVVAHGVDGLCVDPSSVEEIAGALIALLRNRAAAAEMGRNGLRKVLGGYTHEHFRRNLGEILAS